MSDENFKKAVIILLFAILDVVSILATAVKGIANHQPVDVNYNSVWEIHDQTEQTLKNLGFENDH